MDEFGHLDLDTTGAKLLFQAFTEREERRAIAIASNAPFSKAHMFRRTCARQCLNSTGSKWRGPTRSRTYPAGCDRDIRAGRHPDQDAGRLLASHR
ncbi:ATP-binding protein [Streptomyces sp. NPDC017179]|uniref:ATP-binding protein n=1 Tax=Streptomyces sp. NPDC017179 TaxID=3364979 RepID=UPI00379E0F7E